MRPGASLFERKARVCDANSGMQEASSEADAALTFWLLLGQAKSNKKISPEREVGSDRNLFQRCYRNNLFIITESVQ